MSFKTVKDLEDDISAKLDRVVAIAEIAKVENRQYSEEEAAEVEAVNASVEKDKKALELQKKIEANIKDRAAKEGARKIENRSESGDPRPVIKVPARARLHGELKAFKGPKAERNAFVAGQFLAATICGNMKAKQWCKEHGVPLRVDNAMSENENDRGGVFVPNEMSLAIIRLVEEFGVARRSAQIEPMASNTKTIPVRVSGMTAFPVGETKNENEGTNTGVQSQPEYTNIELVARKWKAWLKMSDEINEDSAIMIADQVALECALAFAFAEDNSCFNGDATSAFHGILGILNALRAGSKHTAGAGRTAFSTLNLDDFRSMKGKLPRFAGMQPAWYISPEGYSESMERLLLAANGTLPGDIENGGNLRFLGFPVILTNVLNSTLTPQINTDLLVLGDMRMGVRFGDRRQMTLSATDQRYWDEDQVAIKATSRFDINVHSLGTATAAGALMVLRTPGA